MILRMLAFLSLPALVFSQEKQETSILRFANQDRLPGRLEALTKEHVVWNSPIQVKAASFWLKDVLDLTLPAETPVFQANHEATLTLARGDSVRGQVASVSSDTIELDTWFAGRLKFPRVMVRELKIADRPVLLYRGPTSMEGWTQSVEPHPWKYESASFRSHAAGSIGRNLELPDEFRLIFDAAWRDSFNLAVILFSDDVSTESPENGYEMSFQRRSVRLQRCGTHNWIGNPTQNVQELQEDEKARIEIRASVKTKTICFLINDRIVEVWNDPALERESLGRGIQFVTQDNGPVKISGIEIAAWDGVIDETPQENRRGNRFRNFEGNLRSPQRAEADKTHEGRMMLRNGDSIAGEVISIAEGMITLKTSFEEVKLPVSRLRNIMLKPASLEEPKRMIGDVRGWFLDGSSLVFRIDRVDSDKIQGFSQNFGSAEFNLKAFSRLEFNIYSQKLESLRDGGAW